MNENTRWAKIVKNSVFTFIIVLIIAVICLIILKYHVEGEQNMPFDLSEVLVVSTAEGYQKDYDNSEEWNVEIYQTNDIYLNFKKNKNYKQKEIIKSIEINNITINKQPKVGKMKIYIPNDNEKEYNYEKDSIGNNITYEGNIKSDLKNLKIANQGGTIIFRIVNETGKTYENEEEELKQDGTLLEKVGISNEEVSSQVSFDIKINLESGVSFCGNVKLDLPTGDIVTQGVSSLDKKNTKDIVFKRE